jgi:hypothetical protein
MAGTGVAGVTGVQELQEFRSYRSSGVTGVQEQFSSLGYLDCAATILKASQYEQILQLL